MTMNGLDIYYTSKNIGRGLKPVSIKKTASGLKPVSNKKTTSGLKPIKWASCKKLGAGLKILQ